jgi:L-amino acid N-acyltransferase YncA
MHILLRIKTPEQLAEWSNQGLRPDPQLLRRHAPDAHWVVVQPDRTIAAHSSLWWQNPPSYPNHRLGLIGHYAAQSAASAHLLLDHACEQLAAQGCTLAIAPIDGNTWRRYRLLSDRGTEPVFFLEPDNPDEWCDHFSSAGFTSIAQYSSALSSNLTQPSNLTDVRLERAAARLAASGVQIRSIDLVKFEQELTAIYSLSLISFRHNFLYTPIDRSEFMAQYNQIQPYIQPELVLMAEQQATLVGFLFAIPDRLQTLRGQACDTVIIKTVAVLPDRAYAGLGNLLVAAVQTIAHRLGYTRAIHALMHDANRSRNLSDRYAQTMRRYTLFGKPLN